MAISEILRHAYEDHRTDATWGTRQTSPVFFDTWHEKGLPAAVKFQIDASIPIGKHPALRAAAALLGSSLLLTGIEIKAREARKNNLAYAPLAIASWGLVLSLLRFGCGESVTIEGRSEPGTTYDSNQNTTVHLTGADARIYKKWLKAHSAFTPNSSVPPCEMEAYNKYYQEKKGKK